MCSSDLEKIILALEKHSKIEDKKSKKVTFSQYSKNKVSKDPFDIEGLQKVLKTISNDMIEIKKQVAQTLAPTKSFRPFKKNPSSTSQPPNVILNAESDQDTQDPSPFEQESKSEEEFELNGLWDFILPTEEEEKLCLCLQEVNILLIQLYQVINKNLPPQRRKQQSKNLKLSKQILSDLILLILLKL